MIKIPLFAATFFIWTLTLSTKSARANDYVVGAIGDSISVGFNAERIGSNHEYSWATGTDVRVKSHAVRLAEFLGRGILARNVAVAGSVVSDLSRQLDQLTPYKPDYTTITIGANDICTWRDEFRDDAQEFESSLRETMARLVAINSEMKVQISPIPDMYKLWRLSVNRPGCQMIWDLFGICTDLLGRDRTEQQRQQFMERWRTANDIINQIAEENPEHVIHNADLASADFTAAHISRVDCYHPSPAGQALFAEKTWELFLTNWPEMRIIPSSLGNFSE